MRANGYLGAYLNAGFAAGLFLQVGAALRKRLPRVLGRHRLALAWGYNLDNSRTGGIGLRAHADDAAVTANFWITPDAANAGADGAAGGLVVYPGIRVPAEIPFDQAGSHEYVDGLLQQALREGRGNGPLRIPYRQNRCVLFRSSTVRRSQLAMRGVALNQGSATGRSFSFRSPPLRSATPLPLRPLPSMSAPSHRSTSLPTLFAHTAAAVCCVLCVVAGAPHRPWLCLPSGL